MAGNDTKRTISFSPPDMSELEEKQVVDTLRSGWITTGPRVKKLEHLLARFVEVNDGLEDGNIEKVVSDPSLVCLNSATAAEEMIFRVLGIGPGDEVIVPAYTYTSSAAAAIHVGAKVIFVDSQPDSLEMDYDKVREAITPRTKAIVPVDLGGVPCDYDKLYEIVTDPDVKKRFSPLESAEEDDDLTKLGSGIQKKLGRIAIVADGAHALGAHRFVARWSGDPEGNATKVTKGYAAEGVDIKETETNVKTDRMVGSIADFSSFSFHAVKNFTTAEGGAASWSLPFTVPTDAEKRTADDVSNQEIYHWFQLLSLHGQSKDALAKTQLGAWEYDIVAPLYKCNMTDIMGGIGLAQLERYPGLLERRKEIVQQYDAACDQLGVDHIQHFTDEYTSSGHLYITRITGAGDEERREIIVKMAENGVAANVHYKPLPMMTAYKRLGWDIKDFPNAYNLFHNEITLPLHTRLRDEDVKYVIETFSSCVREVRG